MVMTFSTCRPSKRESKWHNLRVGHEIESVNDESYGFDTKYKV